MGSLKYFFDVEIARSKEGIFISRRKYTHDLLEETEKLRYKLIGTPLKKNWKNIKNDKLSMDIRRYQLMVGRLIYLSLT